MIKLSEIQKNPEKIKEVKTIQYISLTTKSMVIFGYETDEGKVEGIVDMCVEQRDDGLYYENLIQKEMLSKMFLVQVYTENINFDEIDGDMGYYDFYMTSGLYQHVLENIPNEEYFRFEEFIENGIYQELKTKNSLSSVINRGLNLLIEKMPDEKGIAKLIRLTSKEFKNFDIGKLDQIQQVFGVMDGGKKPKKK